ncbi:hypothetical protein ACFY3O_36130 [Streptomyces sp. NPDC001046]|uniref:hypothetical protein n=1 Tax=Streptomyces sp. NPDC001046 TaxID=3364543 RepID=UPI00367A4028
MRDLDRVYQTLSEIPHACSDSKEYPMGRSTPRRRRAKRPSGHVDGGKRNRRNESLRYVNRFGTPASVAFLGVLFTGYMLVFRPPVHLTVSQEAVYALAGVLSGAAFRIFRRRHYRR